MPKTGKNQQTELLIPRAPREVNQMLTFQEGCGFLVWTSEDLGYKMAVLLWGLSEGGDKPEVVVVNSSLVRTAPLVLNWRNRIWQAIPVETTWQPLCTFHFSMMVVGERF